MFRFSRCVREEQVMISYAEINTNIGLILPSIEPAHVTEYDWLVGNIHHAADGFYQRRYKRYWGLNDGGLSKGYYKQYFRHLRQSTNSVPVLSTLVEQLYQVPTRKDSYALQFSFCTKLCHMIDRNLPIYDSNIMKFYDFTLLASKISVPQQIRRLVEFHQYLVTEYNRVLELGLLRSSIEAFRQYFHPQHFTDVKVIDSLICASEERMNNSHKEKNDFEAVIKRQIKALIDEQLRETRNGILQPEDKGED
jgi:hypothetical protein